MSFVGNCESQGKRDWKKEKQKFWSGNRVEWQTSWRVQRPINMTTYEEAEADKENQKPFKSKVTTHRMADGNSPSFSNPVAYLMPAGSDYSEEHKVDQPTHVIPRDIGRPSRRGGVVKLTQEDIADAVEMEQNCLLGYWIDKRNFSLERMNAYFQEFWSIRAVAQHRCHNYYVIKLLLWRSTRPFNFHYNKLRT